MIFVDTNYFIRFLRNDIKKQHNEALSLFYQASRGQVELITSTLVIFEIYWVLSSFYKYNKAEISKSLLGILKMKNLIFEEKDTLILSIGIYLQTNFDLEDSYNLIYSKKMGVKEFKTFDKKLKAKFSMGI